ncbi:helix-turn-helix domain-containing protein [Chitinophaga sp. GCM10012297]|uniref:AraC family transcriptional regulator n=1 Tax=Chitinophaga chungangae TaxID=2821488 RepID=A0ABS3YCA3_9BACT|nr:helix-turn-helix transcriptional regulator [Chitinophaga chungangae]MBO9152308.1 AraC family transcriptional regulator [Chitinophaga chungangae]
MITAFSDFNHRKASVQKLHAGDTIDMALCRYDRSSEDEFFMPHAAITCVRQGKKVVYLEGKKHEMKEGDALFIPKYSVIYSDISVKKEAFLSLNTILHHNAPPGDDAAAILANIAATITDPLPLAELARLHHMSLSTFKRWALRHTGGSAGRWIGVRRLERARYLLEHKRLTVSQACHESGFHDLSYFIGKFREHFGVTPGQFQKLSFLS